VHTEAAPFLQALYEAIWERLGASGDEARLYASAFVNADLAGKDTQGIACMRLVYPRIRRGAIRFGARLETIAEGPCSVVLDGGYGPGQVVASKAMTIAIEKARAARIGCVWVRHTNVFTMASHYSTMALAQDCVGLAGCNGVPLVAPWGGRDPVFNTSPLSFAIPAGSERPIIFDGSVSSVSHGRVVLAARDGARLTGKHLVDRQGRFTNDARRLVVDAYDRNSEVRGAILPLGHKGFAGLILMEVLTGILAGMSTARTIPVEQSAEHLWSGGLWLAAIDVGKLVPIDQFKAKVDELIRDIKASRIARGFRAIVVPGHRAMEEAERRKREGVPVREEDWSYVCGVAAELDLDVGQLRADWLATGPS
jgi:L-2-hydroxycarboxylate dehydrogenase (NAD+)